MIKMDNVFNKLKVINKNIVFCMEQQIKMLTKNMEPI